MIENLSNPGQAPVDGDVIRITHDSGATEEKQHWSPPAPAAPAPVADPCGWFVDLGPFYDRFGAAKMAVLTSTDAGVRAIVGDVAIRKWIDLERADVASALTYIGSVVPALTPAIQTAILTTAVTDDENMALRKLYFR